MVKGKIGATRCRKTFLLHFPSGPQVFQFSRSDWINSPRLRMTNCQQCLQGYSCCGKSANSLGDGCSEEVGVDEMVGFYLINRKNSKNNPVWHFLFRSGLGIIKIWGDFKQQHGSPLTSTGGLMVNTSLNGWHKSPSAELCVILLLLWKTKELCVGGGSALNE